MDTRTVSRSITPVSYFTVYPNPVQGMLNIYVTTDNAERIMADVFDMNGRKIITRSFGMIEGRQTIALDMSKLGNGTYVLRMTIGNKTTTQLINKF
jgi:hypothetical protein